MGCRWKSRSSGGLYLESTRAEQLGVLPGEDRPVREVMSRRIVIVAPSNSLREAVETMRREGIPGLIVQDRTGLHGLLTERDITIHVTISKENISSVTVEDILRLHRRRVVTCCENDTVADALSMMKQTQVTALPVLNEDGAVTGLLTLLDVAACVMPDAAAALLNDVRNNNFGTRS
jgi:CBS domain-containing protein